MHRRQPVAPGAGRQRIGALDILRGVALCGILVVNVKPIAHSGTDAVRDVAPSASSALDWLSLFADQRFFPIFSLLFGIGFSLLLDSAAHRAAHPRLLLLRRLLVLLVVGLPHMFLLWRGDILTIYAVVGLVVLLPSSWLPRWAVAGLSGVLLGAAYLVAHGGTNVIPGLFLLGSALVRYGVIDRVERSTRVPAMLGLAFAVASVPALWWQAGLAASGDVLGSAYAASSSLAGLLVAGVYVCVVLVLCRTPLRPVLRVVFAPLGRMALTNYLTATVLVLVIGLLVGGSVGWSARTVFLIAGAILTVQCLWSTLWLRRYRFGPLEWLWRWATWARRPPYAGRPE